MLTFNDPHLIPKLLQTAQRFPISEASRLTSAFKRRLGTMASEPISSMPGAASAALSALVECMEAVQRDLANEALAADERSGAWLTVSEILGKRLPGLPTSRAALVEYLNSHGLTTNPHYCRKRERSKGAPEFYRLALTRSAISQRAMPVPSPSQSEALLEWIKEAVVKQPALTVSGLQDLYRRHLQEQKSPNKVPTLKELHRALRRLSKGGN